MRNLVVIFLAFAGPVSASWSHFAILEVDHTKCGSSTSSSFPILVSATDASLKDVAHGGYVVNSTGTDILFYSDSTGTVQIPSELDFYDNVGGTLRAWVQGSCDASSSFAFALFVGNPSPPVRMANPWDSHFLFVGHLDDNAAGTAVIDSTIAANNGIHQNNTSSDSVTGKIGSALNYSGYAKYTTLPAMSVFGSSLTHFTFSLWFKRATTTSGCAIMVSHDSDANTDHWGMGVCNSVTNTLIGPWYNGFNPGGTSITSTSNWNFEAATFDGSTAQAFINGVPDGTSTGHIFIAADGSTYIGSGNVGGAGYSAQSIIDEVHISNIARSADWLTAEYNNQNVPGNIGSPGFLTWGAWVEPSGGTIRHRVNGQ